MKKITAVVVTFNRKTLLKKSIEALISQNVKGISILVVDNASTDGTKEYIDNFIKNNQITYFNTGANLGGAGGFNYGIKEAVKTNSDYIWIMDDDCIVHNDSLENLLKFANSVNDNFGFLSSKVLWKDGTPCNMNIQRKSISDEITDFNNSQKVKLASFVSLFLKREIVEELGLPIKEFFIWGDDWEYTSRISKKYDCYFVPESVVTHESKNNIGVNIVSDTSDRFDRYFYAYRNEGYFYKQQGLKGKIYFLLKVLYHKIKILLKSKNKKAKLNIIAKGCKALKSFNPLIEYCNRCNNENLKIDEKLKKYKLSIIIPVYNGAKFINKFIDKVLKIDLNKEIIVINDCSKDNSLELLRAYGNKIKLIDLKENGGVSNARNCGLDAATGDYFTFMDIDDDFELDMHKKLLSKIIKDGLEICICNNDVIQPSGEIIDSKYKIEFNGKNKNFILKQYLFDKVTPAVWASIYSKNIIKDIKFQKELRIGEDILFVLKAILKAKNIGFVNENLYHYIQYPQSAMHVISDKLLDYLKIPEYLSSDEVAFLEKNFKEEFEYFKLELIERSVHAISQISKKNKKNAKILLKKIYSKNDYTKIIKNKNSPKYIKLEFFVLKNFGINFHLFMFPIYTKIRDILRG